jgi:hypothetical protein
MPTPAGDRAIVRDLMKQVADLAALPVQQESLAQWQALNQLQPTRPLVCIFQVPWHEMNWEDELTCRCETDWARGMESGLRMQLYQWEHFRDDQIIEGAITCPYAIHDTGFGVSEASDVLISSGLASRHFHEQFRSLDDVAKIRMPEVAHDEVATERSFVLLSELFGDILPVVKRGVTHVWFAPWDALITWYGVDQAMLDMALNPGLVNACMERLVDAYLHRLQQWEEQNLLSLPGPNDMAGSGGLSATPELPPPAYDPARITPHDLWGCATPQIFSEVSPEMHWEFALRHELRWLEQWGLNYYGCCEQLHHKMDLMRLVPKLRKISCSPRADKARMADECGSDYVISLKPNPAILAYDPWNPEVARRELREDLAQLRGCVVEIVLKDISTVRSDPRRLWEWAAIAQAVAAEFAP